MYCLPSSSNIVTCLAWISLILGGFLFLFYYFYYSINSRKFWNVAKCRLIIKYILLCA